MKERPILFAGPMVRAIREGRKTQIDLQRYVFKEDDVRHPEIEDPFRVKVDGAMWAVATDGKMLIAVPAQPEHDNLRFVEPSPRGAGAAHPLIRLCTVEAPAVSLSEIRQWAGFAPPTIDDDPDPTSDEVGIFGRQRVHRARLAYLLHGLPGETVYVMSPLDHERPIAFTGLEWRAVLMPMRWGPTFEIPMPPASP